MRAGRGARGMLVRVGRSWYASPMSRLSGEITKALQPGMVVPAPLEQLFTWMETNGRVRDHGDGRLVGCLHSAEEHRTGWTDTERRGGTLIEFAAHADEALDNWFGNSDPAVLNRLSVFARTGGDGSRAAFWLAPDGVQRIVHLGSGSGSTLVCVLGDEPVDFLRLLAIGYDEICWSEAFARPPNVGPAVDFIVHPNLAFQSWVRETFATTIPSTALEVVRHPARMDDDDSPDPFWKWVRASRR